jgi:glucose dehydrogenase
MKILSTHQRGRRRPYAIRAAGVPSALLLGLLQCAVLLASPCMAVEEWRAHGRDAREQRYAPLKDIKASTVSRLGLAWSLDLPDEHSSLEGTPLEVGGTLYFSGSMGAVYAVDAQTGTQLWKYTPEVHKDRPREARMIFATNRGVAYWQGHIFVALKDGRMVALNARNGRPRWITRFLLEGVLATSTGAPRVFKGKVIIGNSGADLGTRGYVTTLDAATGKLLWRFFLVPGDPSQGPDHAASDSIMPMAQKTWSGDWWKYGGGGTAWNAITYDEELNQVYIGTGNGGPWGGKFRSDGTKDNLFLASVVALDADTGHYKWHYQYNMQVGATYSRSARAEESLLSDRTLIKFRLGVEAHAQLDPADPLDGKGSLLAWDPVAQKLRWRVDHPFYWNGGTLSTAGNLVFQGLSTGQFLAYDATSGAKLWSFDAKLGIIAPPISYAVAGKQYVAVLVGYGGDAAGEIAGMSQGWKYGEQPRRLLAFALDGHAVLPNTPPADFSVNALDDATMSLDPKRVARGEFQYTGLGLGTCELCHGDGLDAMGLAPDLRESAVAFDRTAFSALLKSGALVNHNMPKFDDLSDEQIEDLYQYIRAGARKITSAAH